MMTSPRAFVSSHNGVSYPQVFLFTCVSTYFGFIKPAFNAFFLMTLGVPSVVMMVYNLKKEESDRVNNLGRRSIGLSNFISSFKSVPW